MKTQNATLEHESVQGIDIKKINWNDKINGNKNEGKQQLLSEHKTKSQLNLYIPNKQKQKPLLNKKPVKGIVIQNQHIIINYKLKQTFSVSDAKYDESCKCNTTVAEVTFDNMRKLLFKNDRQVHLQSFEYVIVQVDGGIDVGTITACGNEARDKQKLIYNDYEPDCRIIRHANSKDLDRMGQNKSEGCTAFEKAREIAEILKLNMKITAADWQFDRQKLTVLFTAPTIIDFRELVKELAKIYHAKIDLRQISTREQARRIGGMGPCGLNLCCSSFINESSHVSLYHAKQQHLTYNLSKLCGYCCMLKCCLLYEYDSYVDCYKKYPPVLSKVETMFGIGVLKKIDIFNENALLYYKETGVYKTIKKDELQKLVKGGKVTPPAEREYIAKEKEILNQEVYQLLEEEY